MKKNFELKGFSLIEAILAIALFMIFVSGLIVSLIQGQIAPAMAGDALRATYLAEEAIEAVNNIAQSAINEFKFDQSGLQVLSNTWQFDGEGSTETIDKFTRTIYFEKVCRNTSDEIVACPGSRVDLNTMKVNVVVEWQSLLGKSNHFESSTYITNWDSSNWTEDSEADFADSQFFNLQTSATLGDGNGAVILEGGDASPEPATWNCISQLLTYDISGSNQGDLITKNGDYIFVAIGNVLKVFNVASGSPVFVSSYNASGTIYGFDIYDNYIYLATSSDTAELEIVNISNLASLVFVGSYDAGSKSDGYDVYVDGLNNRAYLVTKENKDKGYGPEFYILDISTPSNPTLANATSSFDMDQSNHKVVVQGNYAYIASEGVNEFIVLDISDESNVLQADVLDISGSNKLNSVLIKDNYAYLAPDNWLGVIYQVDITDPNNIFLNNTINVDPGNTNFNNMFLSGDYLFLAASKYNAEIVILNIADTNNIVIQNTIDYPTSTVVNDIYVDDAGLLFAVSDNSSAEICYYQSIQEASWACLQLDNVIDITDTPDAIQIYVREEAGNLIAYIVRTWGSEVRLYIYDVTDHNNLIELGYFGINADINDFVVSGNYAYLATSLSTQELVILDISNPAGIVEVGSYDIPKIKSALSVDVLNNKVYLGTPKEKKQADHEFYIFDTTIITTPTVLGSFEINADVADIIISGDYAYLATSDDSAEVLVLNISDSNNIAQVNSFDTADKDDGEELFIEGNYLYITNGKGKDLNIINISDLNNLVLAGIFTANDDLTGLFVENDIVFVASHDGQKELKIIDVSDKLNPTLISEYNNNWQWGYDVYKYNDKLYFANGDDNAEIKIISQQIPTPPAVGLQLEVNTITTDETWVTVNTINTYTDPVVIASYYENNNSLPVSVRVRNITSNSFQVRLQNPSGADLNSDEITYLVIEAGEWELNGVKLEAGHYLTNTVGSKNNWLYDLRSYLRNDFSDDPIVFHQVVTENDSSWITTYVSAYSSQTDPPSFSDAGYRIALNGAEATASHGSEVIAWLAIEKDKANIFDSVSFETNRTTDSVQGHDDGCYDFNFQNSYSTIPQSLVSQQEMDGGDGSWAVVCNQVVNQLGMHAEEDMVTDAERSHPNETFSFITFAGSFYYSDYIAGSYATSGYMVSSDYNMGQPSSIQIISWQEIVSISCSIKLQLSAAPDVLGSPGVWTDWYGATGVGSYFTNSEGELVPTELNGYSWVKYRAEFDCNSNQTPILSNITINYK